MARSKNSTPLPLVKPHCGLRLPPDRYCLSSCNFKLRPNTTNQKKVFSFSSYQTSFVFQIIYFKHFI